MGRHLTSPWSLCINPVWPRSPLFILLQVGEWLFRPSGSGSISLSWLALEDLVLHIPVKEEEKEAGDAVGKKLTVQGRVYQVRGLPLSFFPPAFSLTFPSPSSQELDQIVAQYIQPMNDLIDSITSHRKFRRMAKEQVEDERGKQGRRKGFWERRERGGRDGWDQDVDPSSPRPCPRVKKNTGGSRVTRVEEETSVAGGGRTGLLFSPPFSSRPSLSLPPL